MVDLNDVALFVHVVRAGGLAGAARRLGVPSNTVSRRLQKLEKHLGLRLLQRSTRRLSLTEAGQTLFGSCAESVDALAESTQNLVDGRRAVSGKVRVAAPADFFDSFPTDALADFLAVHPKVQVEFELSDTRADLLDQGIDVALRAGKVIEPNLIARQVGWSSVTLVASPAYVARRGLPSSLAELAEHDCITRPATPRGRTSWQLDGPLGESEVDVSGPFRANSIQAQLAGALAGLGIGLLPTMLTAAHVSSGALQELLPDYGMRGVGVYFVYLSRQHVPRAVTAFVDFAIDVMLKRGLVEVSPPDT